MLGLAPPSFMPYGMRLDDLPAEVNAVGTSVLGIALGVHRSLGPGLMESVYCAVLAKRLRAVGHHVLTQTMVPAVVDGEVYGHAFRADLLVDGKVVIEVKVVDVLHPRHREQLRTYLRFSGCSLGFLFNFGEARLKDGMERVVLSHRVIAPIAPSRLASGALAPDGSNEGTTDPTTVTCPTLGHVFED